MAFPLGTAYHADSDADDEYERSVVTSPTHLNTDSDASPSDSEPPSNEHTPTTYGNSGEDQTLPRSIITEWTAEECAHFIAGLGLRQYSNAFLDNEIVGEALVALKHEELKEMGIASVGHRLTILKNVYEIKASQDIPMDSDHYVPISAEQNPMHDMATKDDIQRLAKAIIRIRDERLEQAESELRRLADDYRKLRQELLPVFKMAKERSEPLPYAPHQATAASPELYQHEVASPTITQTFPEKTSLTRTFSKKLFSSSTPKNNSPTHLPGVIHEGKPFIDATTLDPSAAATSASNQLTASMNGGILPSSISPSNVQVPSPTSPLPYHQPLAPRSYARDGGAITSLPRFDGADDPRSNALSSPPITSYDPPNSATSLKSSLSSKANPTNSTISTTSTIINPSAHTSLASTLTNNTSTNPALPSSNLPTVTPPTITTTAASSEAPSVEIFKSFRVGLDDPCHKVLPAALRKYQIQADWRQYALYIVYGDQERAVGMDEKPLALFKDLDREGKKPMFMLRRLASAVSATGGPEASGGVVNGASSAGIGTPGLKSSGLGLGGIPGGGAISSAASVRGLGAGVNLPGGLL